MRLLALMTDAFGGAGGIARFNRDLLSSIARTWPDVSITLTTRGRAEGMQHVAGIDATQARTRSGYALAAVRAAMARGGVPDVVLCGHLHLAPLAAPLAKATGAALWLHMHGIEAWRAPSRLVRRAAAHADLVTAVSRYTREEALTWLDVDPDRCAVLPNTVDERFYPAPRSEILARRFAIGQRKVLLTVGRLSAAERYKGHDRIIAALPQVRERHPDVVYLIAGEGDDAARLAELSRTHGVADLVSFLGHIADEDLPDLFRLADLFVMPSTGEGFGIVYLEAMACGVPALGLAVGGAVDALGAGALGILASPGGLATTIATALDDRRTDPAALSRAVHARFGRDSFDRTVAAILRRLVRGPRRVAA